MIDSSTDRPSQEDLSQRHTEEAQAPESSFAAREEAASNQDGSSSQDGSDNPHSSSRPNVSPDELSDADLMSLPGRRFEGKVKFSGRSSWAGSNVDDADKDPLLGTTLHDTYAVSRVLGEGGMGRVYEAHHTRIASKRYAIKVLHSEFTRDPDIRLRFQREAEAAATIEHDGVVGTYDVGKTPEGWPYMVCEYLSGVDLNDYLQQRGTLPARTIVHIGKQLCSALSAAHARGVIHRDLKPHNVFVMERHGESLAPSEGGPELPAVKVLDFGLSRFVENDNELTKTGIILGTPGYMAPEQADGRGTDTRTDIYGIGALLYAAATGRPPFKADSPQLTVLAVMSQVPPRPRDLAPSIPVDLEVVIQKAMARNPDERYQTASEMEAALAGLYAASTPLNRRGAFSATAPPLAPRLSLVVYAGSALLFGGVSLLGAAFAVLELRGIDYASFRPSVLEGALLLLLALLLLFPLWLFLRAFRKKTWDNSARVVELIPKLERPLVAALLAYGLSALLLRLGAISIGVAAGSLSDSELLSSAVLYVILPINAALAASTVWLKDAFQTTRSTFVRAITGVGAPAGALAAGLLLLAFAFLWHPSSAAGDLAQGNDHARSKLHSAATPLSVEQDPTTTGGEAPQAPNAEPPPTEQTALKKGAATTQAADGGVADAADLAPKEELAIAAEEGAESLEKLQQKYPRDKRVLKALVLAHASRADTLARSVNAIGKLLETDPESKEDADVLFILKKALRSKGAAHAAAAATVKNQMGPDGAELIYQLMNEHPEQRSRLKVIFFDLRKAQLASPELLVAYDLRYATSCSIRLQYLDRAEKYGDTRSLRQLQALSTAPRRCGWGRTCYPPCRAEAERFKKSAEIISARLSAETR